MWPAPASNAPFSITDNGKGLTAQMFEQRWRKIEYNRIADEGEEVARWTKVRGQALSSHRVADFLDTAVTPDWKGFEPEAGPWKAIRAAVHAAIHNYLATFTAARGDEAKETVRDKLHGTVSQLSPAGRDKWNGFVIDTCLTISTDEVQQVAVILANLELSSSKHGLVQRLQGLPPGDLDQLHQTFIGWTVHSAKLALDEILSWLKLIEELDRKLRDESADEVRVLQPLFDRSLWVFGPEFNLWSSPATAA